MLSPNPDLLVRHYLRSNRWAHWRAQTAESVFLAFALLAFAVFALWVIDPVWARLLDVQAPWTRTLAVAAIGLGLATALVLRAIRAQRTLAEQHAHDWLATQPISPHTRHFARTAQVRLQTLGWAILILAMMIWAASRVELPSNSLLLALGLGTLCGAGVSAIWPERPPHANGEILARPRAVAVAIAKQTQGLPLLGAALEPTSARLPRSAPWVAFSFLLFPPSTPIIAVFGLVLMFTALALALDLVSHWHTRYIDDQNWLAAQPLAPKRLFWAYLPYLFRRSSLLVLSFGICIYALGAPWYFAATSALLLAGIIGDALLCGFATRRHPERYSLLLILHLIVVIASFQVLPPAAPLIFIFCAMSAWWKGLQ